MEERYFADESIVDQSSTMIASEGKPHTNGISIVVETPPGADAVEVLLEYSELKAAIAELEADREAMPHLYAHNAKVKGDAEPKAERSPLEPPVGREDT